MPIGVGYKRPGSSLLQIGATEKVFDDPLGRRSVANIGPPGQVGLTRLRSQVEVPSLTGRTSAGAQRSVQAAQLLNVAPQAQAGGGGATPPGAQGGGGQELSVMAAGAQAAEKGSLLTKIGKAIADPKFLLGLAEMGMAISPPGTPGERMGAVAATNIRTTMQADLNRRLLAAKTPEEVEAVLREAPPGVDVSTLAADQLRTLRETAALEFEQEQTRKKFGLEEQVVGAQVEALGAQTAASKQEVEERKAGTEFKEVQTKAAQFELEFTQRMEGLEKERVQAELSGARARAALAGAQAHLANVSAELAPREVEARLLTPLRALIAEETRSVQAMEKIMADVEVMNLPGEGEEFRREGASPEQIERLQLEVASAKMRLEDYRRQVSEVQQAFKIGGAKAVAKVDLEGVITPAEMERAVEAAAEGRITPEELQEFVKEATKQTVRRLGASRNE